MVLNSTDGHASPSAPGPSSSRFTALDGLTEDEESLATMVAQLKKKISDIPGPNRKNTAGSVHTRGTRGTTAKGSNSAHGKPKSGLALNPTRQKNPKSPANRVVLRDVSNSMCPSSSGPVSPLPAHNRQSQKGKALMVASSSLPGGDRRSCTPPTSRW